MPARPFTCPACHRTLGTISRKRDQQGNPRDKLRLNDNAVKVGRELFRRQRYAECVCGERVNVPDGVTIEMQ